MPVARGLCGASSSDLRPAPAQPPPVPPAQEPRPGPARMPQDLGGLGRARARAASRGIAPLPLPAPGKAPGLQGCRPRRDPLPCGLWHRGHPQHRVPGAPWNRQSTECLVCDVSPNTGQGAAGDRPGAAPAPLPHCPPSVTAGVLSTPRLPNKTRGFFVVILSSSSRIPYGLQVLMIAPTKPTVDQPALM